MYRPTKPLKWCQCCLQGVTFSNLEGSSNLLGDHNSPQIVHPTDDTSSLHSIFFSFSAALPKNRVILSGAATGCAVEESAPQKRTVPSTPLRFAQDDSGSRYPPTIILQITLLESVKQGESYDQTLCLKFLFCYRTSGKQKKGLLQNEGFATVPLILYKPMYTGVYIVNRFDIPL